MRLPAIFLLMCSLAHAGSVNQLELALIGPIKNQFTTVPNKASFAQIDAAELQLSEDQTLSPNFSFLENGALDVLAQARFDLQLDPLAEKQYQFSTEAMTDGQINCNVTMLLNNKKYVDARIHGICFLDSAQPRFFYHERRMKIGQLQFIDTPVLGILFQLK